jgi:hypothetical protein
MKKMILVLLSVVLVGCASTPIKVSTPPPDYVVACQELGMGQGRSSGVLLLEFIPIALNERLNSAYQQALSSFPGGTHLVNPSVQDYWYYIYVGVYHVTKVSGKVISCPTVGKPITSDKGDLAPSKENQSKVDKK